MDNSQLCDWMGQMGASEETLKALQLHGMDGPGLMYCLYSCIEEDIKITVDQLKMTDSPITRMRIMSRIEGEVTQEEEDKKEYKGSYDGIAETWRSRQIPSPQDKNSRQ